jgi:putative membrane protein|tara:strand:- start:3325 stop:3867 length:543 start_codon:yes stop_codon:yes gene_type:complete
VEAYNYIKALHLIFVITYFAGLFYIPRLMVYQVEAALRPKNEADILLPQLQLMMRRLWVIITVPSGILATLFAVWLLVLMPIWLAQPWMWVKLVFVGLLVLYHAKTYKMYKEFLRGEHRHSATFFRFWNEGATLILFAVVFLAILKNSVHWIFGLVGLIGLAGLLMLGIRLYKRYRTKKL